jgi:hypothetical protein
MDFTSIFNTKFKDAYLRNNRRGGQKNLRCFPECSEKGHRCSGFCGRAVEVAIFTKASCSDCTLTSSVEETELLSLAEFVTVGKEPSDIAVGRTYPVDAYEADTRCKKSPLRRFVRGIKEEGKPGNNVFHYKPSCWHYSWRSNKHATDTQHFLRVVTFAFNKNDRSTMTCVSSIDTTKFTLFSSKILDKKNGKRLAPTVKKTTRPKKKIKRSNTTLQEPHSMLMSKMPTEEMCAWGDHNVCPPSPVSVTFFDAIQEDDEAFGLSLDGFLKQMDENQAKHELEEAQSRASSPHLIPQPDIQEFVTIDDNMMLDHNPLFKFDPFLLEVCA